MMQCLLDNGKHPDEPYNARLGFWLPTDTLYGNFQLKLMKLSERIDERLKSPAKNLEGIVRNAKYAGTKDGESAWITYYIETDCGLMIVYGFRQYPIFGLNTFKSFLGAGNEYDG